MPVDGGLCRTKVGITQYVFKPLNTEQQRAAQLVREHDVVFLTGAAGTAKTHIALGVALELVQENHFRGLVLCRPLVEAGEKTGFLPGDEHQKMRPWLEPFGDCLESISFEKRDNFFEHVESVPLARMRGRTFSRRIVILDEGQNASYAQLRLFLSRLGKAGKLLVTGDVTQCDLPGPCVLETFARALDGVDVAGEGAQRHTIAWLRLLKCVRHPLVAEITKRTARLRPRLGGAGGHY